MCHILPYYDNILQSHLLMTSINKDIRKSYYEWQSEYYFVLSVNNRIEINKGNFKKIRTDQLLIMDRYKYYIINLVIDSEIKFRNLIELFKKATFPENISIRNIDIKMMKKKNFNIIGSLKDLGIDEEDWTIEKRKEVQDAKNIILTFPKDLNDYTNFLGNEVKELMNSLPSHTFSLKEFSISTKSDIVFLEKLDIKIDKLNVILSRKTQVSFEEIEGLYQKLKIKEICFIRDKNTKIILDIQKIIDFNLDKSFVLQRLIKGDIINFIHNFRVNNLSSPSCLNWNMIKINNAEIYYVNDTKLYMTKVREVYFGGKRYNCSNLIVGEDFIIFKPSKRRYQSFRFLGISEPINIQIDKISLELVTKLFKDKDGTLLIKNKNLN
mmetsp:Transcript_32806/g.29100  ORF Transcript_32806/g.29100 Transcript_32806/m.29100 type:complete len:381 (+) Transcript_32806:75-1217(+)